MPKKETKQPKKAPAHYRALIGITHDPTGQRFEPGNEVPAEIVADAQWLLEQGLVEAVTEEEQE